MWHNRLGTVYEMDLSARTHRKLWSESGHVRDLAVAPGGLEAAYVVARTPAEESVVIRALEPEASGRVVATDVNTATTLTRPAWSPDGADVVFGVFGEDNLFTESFDHCAFHAIARDGSAERTLWSGSTADFPRSFGCPWQFLWEPVSGRLAAFEHCFECPMSVHLDLLDTGASGVAQRIDVLADDQGAAPSPDRVWVAWVESSAYYGEMASRPVWEALNWDLDVESDRWPGRAHVRSLNLVNGGTLDIMSAETAVGFTSPLWAPDGTWLAFAEPLGAVTTPIPPSDDSRPTFAGTGTRLWAVTRDGDVRMKLDLDGLNAWPVAISPDGTFVLVAAGAGLQPTLRLVAYRVADGAGGLVATLGVMDADVAWVR